MISLNRKNNTVVITVYDLKTKKTPSSISDENIATVSLRQVQTTDENIIVAKNDGLNKKSTICVYPKTNLEKPIIIENNSEINCLLVQGRLLFAACEDLHSNQAIKIWDLKRRECISTLIGHENSIKRLRLVDGRLISSNGSEIIAWDLKAPEYKALLFISYNLELCPEYEVLFGLLSEQLRHEILKEIADIAQPNSKDKARAINFYLLRKVLRYLKKENYKKSFAILQDLPISVKLSIGMREEMSMSEFIEAVEKCLPIKNSLNS